MSNNNYNFVIDPISGEKYPINTSEGRTILHNYFLHLDGKLKDVNSQVSSVNNPEEDAISYESSVNNPEEDASSQESSAVDIGENKIKFHGRYFKKHLDEHIIYEGPFSGRPELSKYVENKISQMEKIIANRFGLHFTYCVIAKKPWVYHRGMGYEPEKGVAVNYTFITNDDSLMWRKTGDSHGTRNMVYTKNNSTYYTTWMKNPTL